MVGGLVDISRLKGLGFVLSLVGLVAHLLKDLPHHERLCFGIRHDAMIRLL